jgi:hypothetical protein
LAGGSAALAALLAACTSSTIGTTPIPTTQPNPAPQVFNFQGNLKQTYTYYYGFPTQQPPVTIVQKIKQTFVNNTATPPPQFSNHVSNVVHTVETASTKLTTQNTVTDTYLSEGSSGYFEEGSIAQINAPDGGQSSTTTQIYKTPQILEENDGSWTNSPASTFDQTFSDGHYQDRTIASDGTYVEKGTTFNLDATLAHIKIAEDPTGEGAYIGPFTGAPANTQFTFSAPSGTPPTIALTLYYEGKNIPELSLPAWFPLNPTFYTEKDTLTTGTSAPSSCGKHAGTSGDAVARTWTGLDTVIGYTESYSESTYDNGTDPVCIVISDSIANYYDWQGDTPAFVLVSSNAKPLSTIVTSETLVGTGITSSAKHRAMVTAAIAGARSTMFAKMQVVRDTMREKALHRLFTHSHNGGAQ